MEEDGYFVVGYLGSNPLDKAITPSKNTPIGHGNVIQWESFGALVGKGGFHPWQLSNSIQSTSNKKGR